MLVSCTALQSYVYETRSAFMSRVCVCSSLTMPLASLGQLWQQCYWVCQAILRDKGLYTNCTMLTPMNISWLATQHHKATQKAKIMCNVGRWWMTEGGPMPDLSDLISNILSSGVECIRVLYRREWQGSISWPALKRIVDAMQEMCSLANCTDITSLIWVASAQLGSVRITR